VAHASTDPLATQRHATNAKALALRAGGRPPIQHETKAGKGRYTHTPSAKYPKEYGGKALDTVAGKDFEFGLHMPAGTKFMAQVKKSKKSAATPTIASLDGPQGSVDLGTPNPTSVKKIPITATGPYTLGIAGGNGGQNARNVT